MYEKPGIYKHWDFTILDILMLEVCYFLAFYIRHKSMVPFTGSSYTVVVLLIVLMVLLGGNIFHNYSKILQRGYLKELSSSIQLVTIVTAGLIVYLFVSKDSGIFSRLVLGYFYLLSIIAVYLARILYKKILYKKNTTGYNRRSSILITSSDVSKTRLERLKEDVSGVVEISAIVLVDNPDKNPEITRDDSNTYCGIPVLCTYDDLPDKILSKWVDEIFVLLNNKISLEENSDVLRKLSVMGITLHTVLNTDDDYGLSKSIEKMGDTILLTESMKTISFGQAVAKRLLDICGAIIGLIFTGIFTVIFGPFIYKADPGPIFYKQKRIGRNGRIFYMYKFRSMYQDADRRKQELMEKNEMNGLMFKLKDDPRILGSGEDGKKHGIGWLIRTTSIDEFPQFLNVLIGNMSLVGTRPPTVDEWEKYEYHHRARMAVRPGITGLWQISGRSNIHDFEEVIRLDMEYINNYSLGEDLKIIFKTIGSVLKHEGAE